MVTEEQLLRQFFANPGEVIESIFTIEDKYGSVVPFHLTRIQRDYLSRRTGRDTSLKPRQVKVSSIILACNTVGLVTSNNINCLITTDAPTVTQNFRLRLKRHFDDLRKVGLPITYEIDNEDHLRLKEYGNSIFFTEAGSTGVGRGLTFGLVHMSEVAFWKTQSITPGQAIAGILASVPPQYGHVDIESTPFGASGAFYRLVQAAQQGGNEFRLHFWPWWWEEDYRSSRPADPPFNAMEQALMQAHGLDLFQIQFRRETINRMRPTGTPFEQEYPEDPETCFLAGEANFLPADIIIRLRSRVIPSIESVGPYVRIYKKCDPTRTYIAGVDAAEGIVTSLTADAHACQILDARTMEQVCVIHGILPLSEFADLCYEYLNRYNTAFTGVEVPGPGVAIIDRLEQRRYPNLYWHPRDENNPATSESWRAGWPATAHNNVIALSQLFTALDGGNIIIYDADTVSQLAAMRWMRPKQRRANRFARAEAAPGEHDDLVFALRVAHQIAPYVPVPTDQRPRSEGVGVW